jgi:hypothetical protein
MHQGGHDVAADSEPQVFAAGIEMLVLLAFIAKVSLVRRTLGWVLFTTPQDR